MLQELYTTDRSSIFWLLTMLLFCFLLSCDSFFSGERVGRIKERGMCLKLCLTTSAISLLLLACEQVSKWNSHRSDQSDHDTQNLISFLDGRHQKSTGYPAFLLSRRLLSASFARRNFFSPGFTLDKIVKFNFTEKKSGLGCY